jgi:hypothetical protein
MYLGPRHRHVFANRGREMRRHLWRKENLTRVRIFYRGSWRKTEDLHVASIRRERTGNQTWFTLDRRSVRQVCFFIARN